ncbi:S49 family peptidase [Hymenobacter nivis]|uniref:Peptidase S49 domain-containing protein n=1 Tax=Hymenobacter nivis TaxID=1850093 RepID=A0A502HEY3_9BACT|nr:S49 family peptidase [Hymenobacter nivis]TPG71996.1 hypothetical protein EAH73_01760 [Hymenobacter nivis]
MLLNSNLAAMLQAPFLVEGQALQLVYAEVAQLLNGLAGGAPVPTADAKPPQYFAITPHAAALGMMGYNALDEVPAGSIAVHTVAGVMMPEDGYYSLGTKSIGQRMKQADAHENIVAHVGVFRTPGGSTSGLEDFAATISGTQKPFVSFVQQGCSAGYWSACSGNVVMVAGRTAMLGSIGTMAEFLDFTGYFEKMGIKQVTGYATLSTNKNASFKAAIEGDLKPLQKEILDPLNEVFLSTVLANRDGKIDPKQQKNVLSGSVFIGQANIDNGLADVMGTLDDAIALAQQLADEADTSTNSSSTQNSMSLFSKKLTLGAAAFALVSAETITPEQAAAANQELTDAGVTGAQLITEAAFNDLTAKAGRVDAAETTAIEAAAKVTELTAANTQLTTDLATANASLVALGKVPGAAHSNPALGAGQTDINTEATDENQKAIDEMPHNSALDNHPLFGKRIPV